MRNCLLLKLFLPLLLPGCIGATSDVTSQGQEHSQVVVVVPLDRPYTFTAPKNPEHGFGFLRGFVLSVHDGDTITVQLEDRKENVRLIGIDAPELHQAPWGKVSREALKAIVEGKQVRLETDVTVRDQYKRLLAYVYVGEMLVNLELVRQGQAVLYTVPPNVVHVEDYRKAEQEAREAGRGVWNQAQPLDVVPDCYRKRQKGGEC